MVNAEKFEWNPDKYLTYENKTLEALIKCTYKNESDTDIHECFLPKIDDCGKDPLDPEHLWFLNFPIFHSSEIQYGIDKFPDINGETYCCHSNAGEGGVIDEGKVCNWWNNETGINRPGVKGQTGFACKWLSEYEKAFLPAERGDVTWNEFQINVTFSDLRSGLVAMTGLLDPETNLPWYDTGRQWPKQAECSYGAGMDQMTMTYISFTGYLRYILIIL